MAVHRGLKYLALVLLLVSFMEPAAAISHRKLEKLRSQSAPVALPAIGPCPTRVKISLQHAQPLCKDADTIDILFMGDVMMHAGQIANAEGSDGTYSFSTYFQNIKERISNADLAVANMEFTLAGRPYTGYPCFSAPDSYAEYVRGCGVDVFLMANNHILDRGKPGIRRTFEIYDEMEKGGHLKYTGAAADESSDSIRNPLIVAVKGVRIAIVNFTYGTNQEYQGGFPKVNMTDTTEIAASIRRAKDAGADFIFALPHWGTEYVLTHSASQKKLASWLARKGCDAIIGAHPHVVEDAGAAEGTGKDGGSRMVPVVYSMGNIVSNMSAENTQIGLIVNLKVALKGDGTKTLLNPEYTLTWCTRPGTLTSSYATIAVRDFLDKRDLWTSKADYDNMVNSYERVRRMTGLDDTPSCAMSAATTETK